MASFRHSIQWRIFVYYTAILIVAVGILIAGFYQYEKKAKIQMTELELNTHMIHLIPIFVEPRTNPRERRNRRPRIRDDQSRINRQRLPSSSDGDAVLATPPVERSGGGALEQEARPPRRESNGEDVRRPRQGGGRGKSWVKVLSRPALINRQQLLQSQGAYFRVELPKYNLIHNTDNYPTEIIPTDVEARDSGQWNIVHTDHHLYLEHHMPEKGVILVGKPFEFISAEVSALLIKAIWIGFGVVLVSSFVGFWIISFSLRPIKQVSEAAEKIANGDINERIDTEHIQSELGQMANVLNKTFGRLGEALKRQIQFTSDASHELRTPVAAILADCQFSLKRERSPERYRETIEVCHESAQHMRSLIEDLRDLADFDEKNENQSKEKVEMKAFLENVVSVMSPLASEKGIDLKLDTENTVAEFDPMRMKQAVLNLLGNAIRYTDRTGMVVVRCYRQAREVVIEVKDTGIGIAPDRVKHVFDRFYRSDVARSRDTGGAGLGLSISKSIVEANGGQISVSSELGVGTCFTIRL